MVALQKVLSTNKATNNAISFACSIFIFPPLCHYTCNFMCLYAFETAYDEEKSYTARTHQLKAKEEKKKNIYSDFFNIHRTQ